MTVSSSPLNSTELVSHATKHIAFLRQLHAQGISLEQPSSKSIDRYLNVWLPLVAADNHDNAPSARIPPPEVAWLWHCHRLAPFQYEKYTTKRFGKILEAVPPFECQFPDDSEDCQLNANNDDDEAMTRVAWDSLFPNEPFFLDETIPLTGRSVDAGGFDLVGSTSRQKSFLWHVSQPRFEDLEFLRQGVTKYHNFLALRQNDDALPLVPTFQIDLMWHTHIATSVGKYNQDCIAIRGQKFHHDDSMDDRTTGALLDRSFQETCRLWKEAYGEDYEVKGGMYRGVPPVDFLTPTWDAGMSQTSAEISVVLSGSNSSGTTKSSLSYWKPPGVHDATFIKAAPKSRTTGVNSNPLKTGYVFGKGSKGLGYYSMETKDAYNILYVRLSVEEAQQASDYASFTCCRFGNTNVRYEKQKRAKELQIIRTVDMLAYIDTRRNSSSPSAVLDDDSVKKKRELGMRKNNINDYPTYEPGYWYVGGNKSSSYHPSSSGYTSGENGNGAIIAGDAYANDTCATAAGCGGGTCYPATGGGGAACGGGGCGGGGTTFTGSGGGACGGFHNSGGGAW
eukprot:CAMPEP_0172475808 /NCGR_PEP_ID=MMETSP1065-20121228/70059_1 /TAXON_ID=265537 /ORGANISM="Amphiprora paludosa, Strain CCMP125" /LENGTH=563 /DNA_ID=CAMNT_0013234023 /DNA_START=190 /DNA_END=1878 /DNA_ORIENTATION=+